MVNEEKEIEIKNRDEIIEMVTDHEVNTMNIKNILEYLHETIHHELEWKTDKELFTTVVTNYPHLENKMEIPDGV